MANEIAGKGQVFVCSACGKRSKDLYGDQAIDSGWDESCMLNAVLCDERTLQLNELLKRFLCSQEDIDKWLSFPHPDFGGKTPKEMIENGHIDAVITLIADAFNGQIS